MKKEEGDDVRLDMNNTNHQNTNVGIYHQMDMLLLTTNTRRYRLLEFGAETKVETSKILYNLYTVLTTMPWNWPLVLIQRRRFAQVMHTVASYIAREKRDFPESVNEVTKVQFLQNEVFRLTNEMNKLQQVTTSSTSTSVQAITGSHHHDVSDLMDNRIPMVYEAIPMPPTLPSSALHATMKTAMDVQMVKSVYTRRLPPTNSLTSAIRMGAAIKLRKVQGPRSPGGTPTPDMIRRRYRFLSTASSSTMEQLSLALDEKFKNVSSPIVSPRINTMYETDEFIDPPTSVKLRKTVLPEMKSPPFLSLDDNQEQDILSTTQSLQNIQSNEILENPRLFRK